MVTADQTDAQFLAEQAVHWAEKRMQAAQTAIEKISRESGYLIQMAREYYLDVDAASLPQAAEVLRLFRMEEKEAARLLGEAQIELVRLTA